MLPQHAVLCVWFGAALVCTCARPKGLPPATHPLSHTHPVNQLVNVESAANRAAALGMQMPPKS